MCHITGLFLGYLIGPEEELHAPVPVPRTGHHWNHLILSIHFSISDLILQTGFLHRVLVEKMATGNLNVTSSQLKTSLSRYLYVRLRKGLWPYLGHCPCSWITRYVQGNGY